MDVEAIKIFDVKFSPSQFSLRPDSERRASRYWLVLAKQVLDEDGS